MTSGIVRRALGWLEALLFLIGGVLALWCVAVVLRAEYYARMPIPEPPVATRLPGEDVAVTRSRRSVRSAGTWLARLEAPSVDLAATVLEGSDDGILSRAAGHIEDTAFPGDGGNIGIAGHRDTVFRPLRRMHVGDTLRLTTAERMFEYRVSETKVVNPEDVDVLDSTDHSALTLVTCFPFEFIGHAPRRFIVRADLVTEDARSRAPGGAVENAPRDLSSSARVSRHDQRDTPTAVSGSVVVDAKHQRVVRRHSNRPSGGPHREKRIEARSPDESNEPAVEHHTHRVARTLRRIVAVGARGLRRTFSSEMDSGRHRDPN